MFSRSSCPYIKVEANRCDSYRTFAEKAARKCRLLYKEEKELALFKLNGARILNEPIHVKNRNGKSSVRPWTLGNYLLLMKKSPAVCKIGVAYADYLRATSSDESGADMERSSSPGVSVSMVLHDVGGFCAIPDVCASCILFVLL